MLEIRDFILNQWRATRNGPRAEPRLYLPKIETIPLRDSRQPQETGRRVLPPAPVAGVKVCGIQARNRSRVWSCEWAPLRADLVMTSEVRENHLHLSSQDIRSLATAGRNCLQAFHTSRLPEVGPRRIKFRHASRQQLREHAPGAKIPW